MPYCTACGKQVRDTDVYCRQCGRRQPTVIPPGTASGGPAISPRAASILCYIPWLGWIASVYVLATDKFRQAKDVRFHAYQGLYLFVAWLLVHWAIGLWLHVIPGPYIPVDKVLELALLVVWIFMLVKTSKGERCALPLLGELAERSL